MAADVLTRVRAEIDARLRELRPVLVEHERLLDAAAALDAEAKARPVAQPAAAVKRPAAVEQPAAVKPRPAASRGPAAKPRPAAKAPRAAKPGRAAKPRQAPLVAAEQAIVAALEHGSHTVSELGIVTAMSGADIRQSLRRLLAAEKIVRAKRDGRAAYALSGTA
jgi:hypothetical protein